MFWALGSVKILIKQLKNKFLQRRISFKTMDIEEFYFFDRLAVKNIVKREYMK